jgi:hypothetical protein
MVISWKRQIVTVRVFVWMELLQCFHDIGLVFEVIDWCFLLEIDSSRRTAFEAWWSFTNLMTLFLVARDRL